MTSANLETRKFALAEAVKLCSIGNYKDVDQRSAATLQIADRLLVWLEPSPAAQAQASAMTAKAA